MDGKSTFSPVRSIKLGNGGSINIYPNPSQGQLTIKTGMLGKQELLLMDMNGHEVYRFDQSSGIAQLNGLKPGNYVLKISNDKGEQAMRKVIVQ